MTLISAKRIEEILIDCLIKDSDHIDCDKLPEDKVVIARGIVNGFGFHRERLETYRNEVQSMFEQLAPELKEGISFLNMCVDKDGNQWGEHADCEQLLCLGIGLEIIEYIVPKEMWQFLPGGVPVIKFK